MIAGRFFYAERKKIHLQDTVVSCTESTDKDKKNTKSEIFPVKVTIYTGYNNPFNETTRIEYFTKDDVINKKKMLYADEEIVKSQGYLHIIQKESDSKIYVLIGRERSETAVAYGFEKINKQWFLVEHVDYWGPDNAINSEHHELWPKLQAFTHGVTLSHR